MPTKASHYFVYGNTAQGFVSKLDSNLLGIERLYILRGRPGTGKLLMSALSDKCAASGLVLEYLHCPSAPEAHDGIILPQIRLAVLDGTDLHAARLPSPALKAWSINTDSAYDKAALLKSGEKASLLFNKIEANHENAFQYFTSALLIHDEWEKIYIENMDFTMVDTLIDETGEMLLGEHQPGKASVVKERFFGASTPGGALNYIGSLTAGISKRYFLKGRPGTGKSTFLKKLAAETRDHGLDMELYYCAFDSNSLDMIIWPELDLCLFDSTAPHLHEPSRPSDDIIDMYARCVRPGTDEKYASLLSDIAARYKDTIKSATSCLKEAKMHIDELDALYSAFVKQEEVCRLSEAFAEQLYF